MKFEELDLGRDQFIMRIHEPGDNSLVIDVCAGLTEDISPEERQKRLNAAGSPLERLQASSNSILIDDNLIYRINFAGYIACQVLNESYDGAPEGPVYKDGRFKIFSKSLYLDYVRSCALMEAAAIFNEDRPPLHYGIWSLNHIVDVVSCNHPEVSIILRE